MANYIYDADEQLYHNLQEFVDALASETGDTYLMLFALPIEALFEKIKRRSALRGKLAIDNQGKSQLEHFQITEDERDIYLDFLQSGSANIFKSISGFSKTLHGAFRFNANFGDPEFGGIITAVSIDGLTITDSTLSMVVNEYAGMKLVIASAGIYENMERTIVSNTATEFVINEAFPANLTTYEYFITAQTEKCILIYSSMDVEQFDTNVIIGIEALLEKTLIGTVLRDWYLINRFMDDYGIEEGLLKNDISDLRMHYFQSRKPARATEFFNDNDID